jgi:hypothetical protein
VSARLALYKLGLDEIDILMMRTDLLDAIRNATRDLLDSFTRTGA